MAFFSVTDKLLLKGTRPVASVEINLKEALLLVHAKEGRDVLVIWECGR
jgi:hypothetical protein